LVPVPFDRRAKMIDAVVFGTFPSMTFNNAKLKPPPPIDRIILQPFACRPCRYGITGCPVLLIIVPAPDPVKNH
jgi:hypothetical protein